jgi:hypothetical protein
MKVTFPFERGRHRSAMLRANSRRYEASAACAAMVAWAHQTSSSKADFVAASRLASMSSMGSFAPIGEVDDADAAHVRHLCSDLHFINEDEGAGAKKSVPFCTSSVKMGVPEPKKTNEVRPSWSTNQMMCAIGVGLGWFELPPTTARSGLACRYTLPPLNAQLETCPVRRRYAGAGGDEGGTRRWRRGAGRLLDTAVPHLWRYQEVSAWMTDSMHDPGGPALTVHW